MPSINQVQMENYEFAIKLIKKLADTSQETDFLLSTGSITIALAVCYYGSNGETKKELREAIFGAKTTDEEIKDWISSILALTKESNENLSLKLINRFCADYQTFQFKKGFVQMVEQLQSDALLVNLQNDVGAATEEINKWVADETNHSILNLVPRDAFEPSSALVLVNTLYLKGIWNDIFFDPSKITRRDFHVEAEKFIEIDMMERTEFEDWFEDEDVQVLEMKYHKTKASMVIILPKRKNELRKVVEQLNGKKLDKWLNGMKEKDVHMIIPKFKIEQSYSLADVSKVLGIQNVFNGKADFSPMINHTNGQLRIYNKSIVEVNEYGTNTECPESFVVYNTTRSWPDPEGPKQFIADHPFMFLLTAGEDNNKNILFAGQFYGKDKKH